MVLRVVDDITITIQILRIVGGLDERVGTDKSADLRVVVSAAVVVKSGLGVELLSGESCVWIDAAGSARDSTPGVVLVQLDSGAGDIGDNVHAAQMIVVVEVFAHAFLRGDGFSADADEFCDHSVGIDLVACEWIERDAARRALFYPRAAVVVLHRRAAAAGDGDAANPVVDVPDESLRSSRQHVAVLVVGVVLVESRVVRHRRGVIRVPVGQHRAALVGEVADGVVRVGAACLGLIGTKGAGPCDHPV